MLQPDETVLLTEALRPPAGYRVDVAVATTYSLNLTAILIAPMTFALHDVGDASTIPRQDPVELLDAAQKYLSRTTVFCQSAAIHVPSAYSRIFTFLEDSIVQVNAPREGALFHPKIWAVRYRDDEGTAHHRLLVASRNLTLDNARDTLLVLDEDPSGEISGAPAAGFVGKLPELALISIPAERRSEIADLTRTLHSTQFSAPLPFTGGRLVPLGLGDDADWPFPDDARRILALSPFLAARTLERLRGAGTQNVLVSRPEEIDRLGAQALMRWDVNVLSSTLRLDDDAPAVALDEFTAVPAEGEDPSLTFDGLHAKTVIADGPDGTSTTITGSANLTEAGWSSNVEFGAVLTGPSALCGIDTVLDEQGDSPGLRAVLQPYTPRAENGEHDPATATSMALEAFHQALAMSSPRLDVLGGKDTVLARLDLLMPENAPGRTEIWPITVPNQKRLLGEALEWDISPENVTPFLAVRTTDGTGDARVTRSCCLLVPLAGDVPDRRQAILSALLSDPERMLRYLSFLLGIDDPYSTRMETESQEYSAKTGVDDDATAAPLPPVVLFEPLLRAASRSPNHLASIADQIAELRQLPEAEELIPEEFTKMWDVVLDVTRERRHR
ncbi:phospholipase D family protein [Brachybacterium sp. GCM10030268]|uniref:phospholipase D family protein n=1 Tax=Brachybacterium sp. GCM10030268 TaxID=3273382 RepID=UPI00361CD8EC